MTWTNHNVKRLKAMHQQGLLSSEIARQLGPGYTRNSVTAKLHRLGLLRGSTPQRQAAQAEEGATVFYPPSPPRRFSWEAAE